MNSRCAPRCGSRARRWAAVLPLALLVVGATAGVAGAQSAAQRSGDVVIVAAGDHGKALAGGGSTPDFSLRLPDGAVCPGDSANDNYRVQSFLIPANDDPGAIVWRSIGPSGPGQIALYGTDTNQYVQVLTEMNPGPGQPGIVADVPALSFGVYAPTDVAPGSYRLGLACTLFNTTTNYWDTTVTIERDTSDEPAQIHWTATGATASSSSSSSSPLTLVVVGGLAVLAIGGAAYLFSRRRRIDPVPSPTKETR
jgi:hypothetical protein